MMSKIMARILCFSLITLLILSVAGPAAAQKADKPAAPQEKAAPQPKVAAPGQAAESPGAPADKMEEFAVCTPAFPAEQIVEMLEFTKKLSPQAAEKMRPILLQCDFNVNNQLLGFLEDLQNEVADTQFDNEEQEKLFLSEKGKEIEAQITLLQKPVNDAELKKVVSDLFDMKQATLKGHLADLEKEADQVKKRIAEREKLKSQIIDRKTKEMAAPMEQPPQQKAQDQQPQASDPLAWD
jgi:hypothetical protein